MINTLIATTGLTFLARAGKPVRDLSGVVRPPLIGSGLEGVVQQVVADV